MSLKPLIQRPGEWWPSLAGWLRFRSGDRFPWFTYIVCGLCVLVYLGFSMDSSPPSWAKLSHWGAPPANEVWAGSYWALITSTAFHMELWHVAFNLYWLWILGSAMERSVGTLRYVLFYLSAAAISSALQLAVSDNTGIGASGVVYAIFGYVWVAGRRQPELSALITRRTVLIFLIWLLLCMALTWLGMWQVGNAAHLSGLLFGVLVAAAFALRFRVWFTIPGLVVVVIAAVVPLIWCPWSQAWTLLRVHAALDRGDEDEVIKWSRQLIKLGHAEEWSWYYLANTYGRRDREPDYAEAILGLKKLNPSSAVKLEAYYHLGRPATRWSVRECVGLLGSPESPVRVSAAAVLGYARLDPAESTPALARALSDKESDVAWTAAWALSQIGPDARSAVDPLVQALRHETPWVRMYAADTLGQIGPSAAKAIPALKRSTADGNASVRAAAASALKKIHGQE